MPRWNNSVARCVIISSHLFFVLWRREQTRIMGSVLCLVICMVYNCNYNWIQLLFINNFFCHTVTIFLETFYENFQIKPKAAEEEDYFHVLRNFTVCLLLYFGTILSLCPKGICLFFASCRTDLFLRYTSWISVVITTILVFCFPWKSNDCLLLHGLP